MGSKNIMWATPWKNFIVFTHIMLFDTASEGHTLTNRSKFTG